VRVAIGLGRASYRSGVVGKLLLESTPLFINDFQILKYARSATGLPERISVDVGTKETPDDEINQRVGENARILAAAMREGEPKVSARVVIMKNAEQNSEAWKARLPDALTFLYGEAEQ